MANLDKKGGLQPINSPGGSVKLRRYAITASYATAIFNGDPVVRVGAGTISRATASATNPILGSAQGFFDGDGQPQGYYVASSSDSWTILVANDVDQEFTMQEDSDGSNLALVDRGQNVAIAFTASGDQTTNLSGCELDSGSIATTADEQIRVIDLYETPDNALGTHAVWVVKINNHQDNQGIVGVGI